MLVLLNKHLTDHAIERIEGELRGLGQWPKRQLDETGALAGFAIGSYSLPVGIEALAAIEGVERVLEPKSSHPIVDGLGGEPVRVGGLWVGAGAPVLMAGPCAVESEPQIHAAAAMVAECGGHILRGGAFKPRTSPYSFDGHGRVALGWIREAADAHGLAVVTEAMSEREVDAVASVADLVQIGARNMQNFALLKAAGACGKPLLVKRGFAATVDEWVLAAEHALAAGAPGVILCERGIRGMDKSTRNILDIGAAVLVKQVYGLPVIADPSHAAGRRDLIPVLSRAALAAGLDGLLVEAHPDPRHARSDGPQALRRHELAAVGRASQSESHRPGARAAI